MALQERHLEEREKDRQFLETIIDLQAQESKQMTSMFRELVRILKQKNNPPTTRASSYQYESEQSQVSQDQHYASGREPHYYDMSHNNYLHFNEL